MHNGRSNAPAQKVQIRNGRGGLLDCPFAFSFEKLHAAQKKQHPQEPVKVRSSSTGRETADQSVQEKVNRSGVGSEKLPARNRMDQEKAIREIYGASFHDALAESHLSPALPRQGDDRQSDQIAAPNPLQKDVQPKQQTSLVNRQQWELQRKLKLGKKLHSLKPSEYPRKRARDDEQVEAANSVASVNLQPSNAGLQIDARDQHKSGGEICNKGPFEQHGAAVHAKGTSTKAREYDNMRNAVFAGKKRRR